MKVFCTATLGVGLLSGCSVPGPGGAPDGIHDPYEGSNRRAHAFNRELDRTIVNPVAQGYGKAVDDDLKTVVNNVATNLRTPGVMVNNLLQGDLGGFGKNLYRVVINSTLGIGGLFDPAAEISDVNLVEADFGMTLARWGAPEGAYLELPLLGPSTERDAVGRFVDLFTNPLFFILDPPERYSGIVAQAFDRVGDREQFSDTIDSVLYDSADSYAQTRLIYLQNRRFEVGGDDEDQYSDPYEDPYAQ